MSGAWWAAAGASLWCVSRAAAGQKHPVKALLANAVLGGNGSVRRQELEHAMENIVIQAL